jgi:hypothetical protein
MKLAMAGLTVIAAMSAGSYDAAAGQGLSQLGSLESTPHASTNFATPQTVRMSKLLAWKSGGKGAIVREPLSLVDCGPAHHRRHALLPVRRRQSST